MGRNEIVAISDAGPLIHLDELGCLDVLDFPEILVPETVWREVAKHRPTALQHTGIALQRRTPGRLPSRIAAIAPLYGLHHGELEALALCLEYPKPLLLTDDGAARLAAVNLNLSTHGTIGLVIRAVRRHQRTPEEGMRLLQNIQCRSTLHVRPVLLAKILRQVGQEWGINHSP